MATGNFERISGEYKKLVFADMELAEGYKRGFLLRLPMTYITTAGILGIHTRAGRCNFVYYSFRRVISLL